LSEELATALDVDSVRVSRRGAAVALEIPRQDPQPVRLLPLYRQLNKDALGAAGSIPAMTAVLGLAEDGAPLLIRLPSPDVGHILAAGTAGAGKTTLLRTLVLSLAMANTPHVDGGLMVMLVDTQGDAFDCFVSLPHLTRPAVRSLGEVTEVLHSLVRLMEKRASVSGYASEPARVPDWPHVVLVIDELADLLLAEGQAIAHPLTRLTQRGREVSIHIVAATSHPTPTVLGQLIEAHFPVRLVGRVNSAEEARTASGWSGSGAERLVGRGDFLAVAEGRVLRFHVAHVSEEEAREVVASLSRGKALQQPVALPWPANRLAHVFRAT
jgi:S-DNA-T family DNA segregation ATPase FtsK/SpoIIIE